MQKRILTFRVYRKWFDKVAQGRKRHEFREATDYWRKRLEGREYDEIHYYNGYGGHRPFMRIAFVKTTTRTVKGKLLFATELGTILETRNYNP